MGIAVATLFAVPSCGGLLRKYFALPLIAAMLFSLTALVPAIAATASGYAVSATINLGSPNFPEDVAVDPTNNTVYVANTDTDSVSVINGNTNAVVATIAVGVSPTSVAVDPGTRTAYVANYSSDSVSVINTVTRAVVATVGVGIAPLALEVDTATHTVYVGNRLGSSLSVIDGYTRKVSTVEIAASPESVAVDSGTHTVYVGTLGGAAVTVVDGATHAVSTLAAGLSPESVAVDPVTHTLYVANLELAGTMTVVNGATHAVSTHAVGKYPGDVAVDPVSRAVYVTNYGDNTVSIFDGNSLGAAPVTVPVGDGPSAVTVNPVTHTAYVTSRNSNTVSVITPKGPAGPGLAEVRTEIHSSHHGDISQGQAVTVQAVIAPRIAGAPTPTGWVQFYDWNTKVGAQVKLVKGKASFTYTGLKLGKHILNAKYLGSNSYVPRDTPARTVIVVP